MIHSFIDMRSLPSCLALSSSDIFYKLINFFAICTLKDYQQVIYLNHRQLHFDKPDYIHKYNLEDVKSCQSTSELILKSYEHFASMLYWRGNNLYVRNDEYENWQNIITTVPVLPILVYKLSISTGQIKDIDNFIDDFLSTSTLPSIYNPELEQVIESTGLSELHMHINGTSEADYVWNDALNNPFAFYQELKKSYGNDLIEEQYKQIHNDFKPSDMYKILERSKMVRAYLSQYLLGHVERQHNTTEEYLRWSEYLNHHNISHELPFLHRNLTNQHPYILNKTFHSPLANEARFLFDMFELLKNDPDMLVVKLLYYYLQAKAFFNQILLHQTNQYGFDQFQKITMNEVREESEKQYANRFRQLKGMYTQDLEYLEVRFSPKETIKKHKRIVDDIINGYEKFIEGEVVFPDLVLVGHFIKKLDTRKYDSIVTCRDYPLRIDLENRVKVFIDLLQSHPKYTYYIRGIDAASNELHASPEVFAPPFRFLTRRLSNLPTDYYFSNKTYLSLAKDKGNTKSIDKIKKYLSKKPFLGLTFHAGEDFVHIISGIRMVYEAVIFLNMPAKSRIGHGTALGIDPKFWINQIGKRLKIKQGEWLDNLIFTAFFCDEKVGVFDDIAKYWQQIYNRNLPNLHLLKEAYHCRPIDPMLRKGMIMKKDKVYGIDKLEWEYNSYLGFVPSEEALQIYDLYHTPEDIKKYNKIIEIEITCDWVQTIKSMQNKMIQLLNQKQIAIETMPTSNIRISYYQKYSQHHIFNWDSPNKVNALLKPNLVLASDNPGIFGNHMRAEFSHIYQACLENGISHHETIKWLEKLNKNAKAYRF